MTSVATPDGYALKVVFIRPSPAAPEFEPQAWRPWSWALLIVAAGLAGLVVGAAIGLFSAGGAVGRYEYHLWKYEAENLPSTLLGVFGLQRGISPAQSKDALTNYLRLTSAIAAAEQSAEPNTSKIAVLDKERSQYNKEVERTIQGYINDAVGAAGLERQLPLFTGVSLVWPPVATDFTHPPQLLVRSPRDRIFREGDTLLKAGLNLAQVESIERDTTNSSTVSIVIPLGGIAAYPAIVDGDGSYDALLVLASHEWTHQYLAFWPLGQTYGTSADATTLNETTAQIVGRELANVIERKHPDAFPKGEDGSAPPLPAPTVDFNSVMHDLRLKVDALLKQGKVTEAEQAMNSTQKYLAAHGIFVRKINQAYFAFYGTYGTSPESSNPIGPKVEEVWQLTRNVGLFLANMRTVTSVADLNATIARLKSAEGSSTG